MVRKSFAVISILLISLPAWSQWTVVNLHPAGATISQVLGVRDGKQVGWAFIGGGTHAALWSGSAGSFVDLNPPGSTTSYATAVSGNVQTGMAFGHAGLWFGTAASFVDLNPAGSTTSYSAAMDGGSQAGDATLAGMHRASLWSGTAGSWVDLHTFGAESSYVKGMRAGQQVGTATFFGVQQACLWNGTAASRISLHPAGANESSATGTHNNRQVGYATVLGLQQASLWAGNIGSWLSLHPTGASRSWAFAIEGDHQAGLARLGTDRASIWLGTAKSWVNLHTFLPAEFTGHSAIYSMWRDGDVLHAAGAAATVAGYRAMLWITRLVAPTSFTPVRGIVTGGNLQSLEDSDDDSLTLRPGIVFTTAQPPVEVRFDATAPSASPNGLTFSVESGASFGNAQQVIRLWNYDVGDYETLDTRVLSTADDVAYVTVRTNAERFVEAGTLAIRGVVTVRAIGPAFSYPWTARVDKVWWNFPG